MTVGQLKEVNGIAPRSKAVPRLLVVPIKRLRGLGPDPAADHVRAADPGEHQEDLPHRQAGRDPHLDRQALHRVSVEDLKRWNGVTQATAGAQDRARSARRPRAKGKPRPTAKSKPYKKTT